MYGKTRDETDDAEVMSMGEKMEGGINEEAVPLGKGLDAVKSGLRY